MRGDKIVHSRRDAVVFQSSCPDCDWPLERRIKLDGPVMGSMSWHNNDGQTVNWCPRCDHELPRSELDMEEAA